MDSLEFPTFLESAGREFQARLERAAFYQHPTGIGDSREDVVRQYLQDILPLRFSVDRGKIWATRGWPPPEGVDVAYPLQQMLQGENNDSILWSRR